MSKAKNGILAAAVLLGLAAAAEAQDIIRLKSGSEVKCKITAMTSASITYSETGGKVSTVKAPEVVDVVLGDPPPSLAKADAALANNQYDKAINHYGPSLEEIAAKKARDLHKQFVLFKWAQALALKGTPNEALDMYRKLRNEGGDCWLRAASFQRSLEIAKGKAETYENLLKEMKTEPEPVGSQAEVELAKIKYTSGDFDNARAGFEKVAANTASPFASEAKLFSLRCIRGLKKLDELEGACKRILDDKTNSSPALLQAAGAWMAEMQLKKFEKDKTKWREILMICVQAIALGPPASKDEGEDYALALLTGGKCYVLLGTTMEKEEAKEEYKNRAMGYYREVERGFSKSPLAEIAKKEILALGGGGGDAPKAPNK
jgi:tetratricopeptide (TPR) repeat protein